MPDSTLVTILTGAGACGVFCILFIIGAIFPRAVVTDKDRQIAELKEALEAQRDRSDAAVAAASATRDVMAAIQLGQQISQGGHQ
ncbi:MAG TPA: hypothetical protein VGS06_36180 [Streptosporangiaceae bacterium]|nr:hypothetical protein [Streptosporangiaceae bacterium]